ncbi:hypothetical protein MNB_SV-12-695 [hydrothermal vent metagenome]|uniref:Uncharacterized protein n=1 Tax=hydrothermal vent metagenome TaxID=652676 RepID=A0A1W1BUU6_9ZZZZ
MSYYDDRDRDNGGLLILIVGFILLFPLVPAGDIGLCVAKILIEWFMISEDKSDTFMVISFLLFMGGYAFLLYRLYKTVLSSLHIVLVIFLYYIQGIVFNFLIIETKCAWFSLVGIDKIKPPCNKPSSNPKKQ